jgi:hypothetical protein
MLRSALSRYLQGYFLAIFVLAVSVAFSISDGGLMWLMQPAYIVPELIKAMSFFLLLWYLNQRLKRFMISPLKYVLYGVFFGITEPCLLVVAGVVNQLLEKSTPFASIVGRSAWSVFAVKQVVTWFVQAAIVIAIVAFIPLRRKDENQGDAP